LALYGRADVVDVGPAILDKGIQVPEPNSDNRRRHKTHRAREPLLTTSAQWQGHGDFAVGVKTECELRQKNVTRPGLASGATPDHPMRAYGNAALGPRRTRDGDTLYQRPRGFGAVNSRAATRDAFSGRQNLAGGCGVSISIDLQMQIDRRCMVRIQKPYSSISTRMRDVSGLQA